MHRLQAPSVGAAEAYRAAVGTISGPYRRLRFEEAEHTVLARCRTFDELTTPPSFERARRQRFEVPELLDADMTDLYDKQFSRSGATKAIRDSIKNASPNGLCPYCGQGTVYELDHFLPKANFAGTTVHPSNLVPACRDCNREKSSYSPDRGGVAVLHPYFDALIEEPWLRAALAPDATGFPVVKFFAAPVHGDPDLGRRMITHMEVFSLSRRFGKWGAQLLENFERMLHSPHGESIGLAEARTHLARCAEQESGGRPNTWEGAAYRAMIESTWYLPVYLDLS